MQAADRIVSRFVTMYGDPKTDNLEAYFDEYAKALHGFSSEVLELAGDRILRNHAYRSWPTIGECVKICREAAAILDPKSAPEHQKLSPDIDKPPVDEGTAKQLMASFNSSRLIGNCFEAIVDRCPLGGTVDVSAPWGQEVTDRNGNVVPIRQKKGKVA